MLAPRGTSRPGLRRAVESTGGRCQRRHRDRVVVGMRDQSYDYTLPLVPQYSSRVTTTNQGPIGFLLDGAALYNPYEANHSTVATSDNFDAASNGVTASFLDSCDGHPGPGGQYHYTAFPRASSRTQRAFRSW